MSWLSGLAGRAEELLNKVDQSAAESLNSSVAKPADLSNVVQRDQRTNDSATGASMIQSYPVVTTSGVSATSRTNILNISTQQTASASSLVRKASKKNIDEDLFEFLNADTKKLLVHSRQSSTASNRTTDSGLQFVAHAGTPPASADGDNDSPTGQSSVPSDFEVVDPNSMIEPSMNQSGVTSSAHGTHNTLELENGLLKNEILSLNTEMASLLRRAKQSEQDCIQSRKQCQGYNDRVVTLEQLLREMNDKDSDLNEALKAKDSQIAVLRVRLSDTEGELISKKQRLSELENDRSRILQDHTDSSGMHSQAFDSLKVKHSETDRQLKLEQEKLQQSHREYTERQQKLENDQQKLSETVLQLQRKLSDEKHRCDSLNQQLKHAKNNLESSKHELAEYKEKAARILQSKDRLITSMRENSGANGEMSASVVNAEIAELEQEKIILRQELQESAATIESLRMEVQDLEVHMQTDHEESREKISNLEDKLAVEQTRCRDMEKEVEQKSDELKYSQEYNLSQRSALQEQIHERDREIEKLRNQLMSKKLSTATESELETRLHSLTENLIQKQTLVESLSTERNSLNLQLERMEAQCRDMEQAAQRTATTHVYIGEDEGMRQRGLLPGFMKESPTDQEFTKKVKRAANVIDKFSIRLGVFLRRYPIARVFVILYMLLLHLWVMVVLLTYQPEMHGNGHSVLPVPMDRSDPMLHA